tara:strand:- start:95 stop:322 length:228 start_codon:yes stop_codon:yes gene_type:complete
MIDDSDLVKTHLTDEQKQMIMDRDEAGFNASLTDAQKLAIGMDVVKHRIDLLESVQAKVAELERRVVRLELEVDI